MIACEVLQNLPATLSPFQPFISLWQEDYVEESFNWNLRAIKQSALCYQFKTGSEIEKCAIKVVPDACVNLLFELDPDNPKATLFGTLIKPLDFVLKPNTLYFGFKPYSVLGINREHISCADYVDAWMDLTQIFINSSPMSGLISKVSDFKGRLSLFSDYASKHMLDHDYVPTFIDYFVMMLCSPNSNGNVMFGTLKQSTGYSERYCREKFHGLHGYSPKHYSSIMRFQNVLKKLMSGDYSDLTSLAVYTGYFDQAHFIHDFKKYTGESPNRFQKNFSRL